jgi:hypothetical protein
MSAPPALKAYQIDFERISLKISHCRFDLGLILSYIQYATDSVAYSGKKLNSSFVKLGMEFRDQGPAGYLLAETAKTLAAAT